MSTQPTESVIKEKDITGAVLDTLVKLNQINQQNQTAEIAKNQAESQKVSKIPMLLILGVVLAGIVYYNK